MKKYIALFLVVFLSFNAVFSQNTNREEVLQLSQTYGFIYGQQMVLDKIKEKYPELSNSALRAELKWKIEFGGVETELLERLKKIFESDYDDFIKQATNQLKELKSQEALSYEDAVAYINKVNERSIGNIETPYKERVLMYHPDFIKAPHQEFIRGYKKEYKSTGLEPKSKGIKIRFEYPASWKESDGVRPNILIKVINENGNGTVSFNVGIADLSKKLEGELSKDELKYIFSKKGNIELAESIYTESAMIEMTEDIGISNKRISGFNNVEIDGNPGGTIYASGTKKQVDMNIQMSSKIYSFICKNYLVTVTFSASASTLEEANKMLLKYEPTFKLIMSSMSVLNKYE